VDPVMSKFTRSWVDWHIKLALDCTEISHSPGEWNSLISVIGLQNVLKYVDEDYLVKNKVNMGLLAENVIEIEEDTGEI
jgi:hypothetical protein